MDPDIFICNDINGSSIYVGDLGVLDFPGAPNPPIIIGDPECREEFEEAIQMARENGTLDAFLISLNSAAYAAIHEVLVDEYLTIIGGDFIEITYSISSCVINCNRVVNIGKENGLVYTFQTDCGEECCRREFKYRLTPFDEYEVISDVLFSPDSPCEDNGEGCPENPPGILIFTGAFSECSGQCEILSNF